MVLLLPSLLLILACLSGSFGQKDLRKKVFVFPAPSATAAVEPHEPLTQMTVCLRYNTLLFRPYGLFSYPTRSSDNDFLIYKKQPDEYSIYIGGSEVVFKVVPKKKPSWDHVCVSWDSTNELVQLWLNGEPLPRRRLKRGPSISPEASVVLGQDQDTFEGGFDINQSFTGEISNVNMCGRVMTHNEVGFAENNIELADPLIYWRSLNYNLKNKVYGEDFLAPQNACI